MADDQGTEDLQELEIPQGEEVVDPGQLEGREKPQRHTPPEGSPRWEKIYAEAKAKERAEAERDELRKVLDSKDADIRAMREQFHAVVDVAKAQAETVKTAPTIDPIESEVERVTSKIAELRAAKKQAVAQVNLDLMAELDDQIDDLKDKKADLILKKALTPKESAKKSEREVPQQPKVNPIEAEFRQSNPWSDPNSPKFDMEMASAAFGLEQKLIKDPQWSDVNPRDRLKEVARRIEVRYQVKPPSSMVEGANTTTSTKQEAIKLTDEMKRTARLFYPDLPEAQAYKEYADGMKLIQSRGARR